ncbi:TetR/AcrR family transcriptional regulator [Nocardia sp. alder85J]|uniref:TetR/AcrR family transcriptional regulator n=1 Tax=Nocardia sp. alder85J TaxID=2862949 RepID=UPI001CD5462F|nr:TetR/AcrR family transcriptional regulator [Nocardia sp. alder85J]MCX4094069.1 helix-turn-helix domain containing protein [Nocardia sp. alder85J]
MTAGRADARRNRELLLETARELLTTESGKVPLEAIARAAGVGIGTLYRHFPTREALVEAVYRAEVDRLCAGAAELAAAGPADAALRAWTDRFADYMATKRDMADALRALIDSGAVTSSQTRQRLSEAVRVLLDAGAADGTLRADAHAEDVVASLVGIHLACGPDQLEQAGRMRQLLLDGLAPRS